MNGPVINPIEEIVDQRSRARERSDPNVDVCFLATVTEEGHPTVRALSLRDITPRGIELLINTESPKWQQLHQDKGCELLIFWPTVRRQYRVRGGIEPLESEKTQQYWDRKSLGSRLLEFYYPSFEPQSTPVSSRDHLLKGIESLRKRYPQPDLVPLPEALKGIRLVP
ncbi:MAG: pyridoxamine 5'-phosphate oxidase family protein, partial [Dehalococcoidia bacterium]